MSKKPNKPKTKKIPKILPRTVSVNAPWRVVTVNINGEPVELTIDLSPSHLQEKAEICFENADIMKPIEEERDKAIESHDIEKMQKCSERLVEPIKAVIVATVGEDGYNKIIDVMTKGGQFKPSDCVDGLSQLLGVLLPYTDLSNYMSAAQITAGAADALQKPNRD